jgi:hypothetical protein
LANLNIPKVTNIKDSAFADTGTKSLSITMGNAAPILGTFLFDSVIANKTVTINVSDTATGYGESPIDTSTMNWGNAFRGRGWNGTSYLTGVVNSKIIFAIEYLP